MTIDETIDIFKREKAHCKEHLHFTGKSEEYYKDIQDLIDAYDSSIMMLEKANKLKVTYICDRKRCQECYDYCKHTTDISHAIYFKPVMSVDGKATSYYEEVDAAEDTLKKFGLEICGYEDDGTFFNILARKES